MFDYRDAPNLPTYSESEGGIRFAYQVDSSLRIDQLSVTFKRTPEALLSSSWSSINGLVTEFCTTFCVVRAGEYSSECGSRRRTAAEAGSVLHSTERYSLSPSPGRSISSPDCRLRLWYGLIVHTTIESYVYSSAPKNAHTCTEIASRCAGYESCVCNRSRNVVTIYHMDGIRRNDVMRFIRHKVDPNARELA